MKSRKFLYVAFLIIISLLSKSIEAQKIKSVVINKIDTSYTKDELTLIESTRSAIEKTLKTDSFFNKITFKAFYGKKYNEKNPQDVKDKALLDSYKDLIASAKEAPGSAADADGVMDIHLDINSTDAKIELATLKRDSLLSIGWKTAEIKRMELVKRYYQKIDYTLVDINVAELIEKRDDYKTDNKCSIKKANKKIIGNDWNNVLTKRASGSLEFPGDPFDEDSCSGQITVVIRKYFLDHTFNSQERLAPWIVYKWLFKLGIHTAFSCPIDKDGHIIEKGYKRDENQDSVTIQMTKLFIEAMGKHTTDSIVDICINCTNRLVSDSMFTKTIRRDVSFIISGSEGKFDQSKIGLDLIAPGFSFATPFPKAHPEKSILGFQLGGFIKFKDAITDIHIAKPNIDAGVNLELTILANKSILYFSNTDCREYLNDFYHINPKKFDEVSKVQLNPGWTAKRYYWFTVKGDGRLQSYNIVQDANSTAHVEHERRTKGIGGLSLNFHIYKYEADKGSILTRGGNVYFKLGLDFLYNNNADNNNYADTKVQQGDSFAAGQKKIYAEYAAFKDSNMAARFTFSPHYDLYWMENSKHIGLHLFNNFKMSVDNHSKIDQRNLGLGFGVFGSLSASMFSKEKASSDSKSVLNFEFLVSTIDILTLKTNNFKPEIKLEVPFNVLK